MLIVWKLVYLLLLQPARILDKPLTYFTGISTVKTLNLISNSSNYTAQSAIDDYDDDGVIEKQPVIDIYYKSQKALAIADACNALELFILYAGFIICFPSYTRRKIAFITGGLFLICIINILRCAGLTWVYIYHPEYGNFSHHYLFTFIVYLFIFLLWWWFSKKAGADVKT